MTTPDEALSYAIQKHTGAVVVNWRSRFKTIRLLRGAGFIVVWVRWSTSNWGWVIHYTHPTEPQR